MDNLNLENKIMIYRRNTLSGLLLTVILGLLIGCANTPKFNTEGVNKSLTPQSVIADSKNSLGSIVLWGGTILETKNLEQSTQIEMLAYPLDSSYRPMIEKKPLGRFIIMHSGYLEPTTYEQGKLLSILGSVSKLQSGKIGESQYNYPVISARQLHLWSADENKSNTSFHIGIGVRL